MRLVGFMLVMVVCAGAWAGPKVEARVDGRSVVVSVDGKVFTTYKFGEEQKYPYFFPVNGPGSGTSVTTETSEPYPHHHSLFFACDKVNGANYWQEGNERGQIVSQGATVSQQAEGEAEFEDVCLWRVPGQEAVIRDARKIRVSAPSESLRYIDFEIGIEALTDVVIEQTNHSLFAARMAPELSVKQGGKLVNAEGKPGEKETYGVASPWCDYSGTRNGVTEGLAILQHPKNRWYPAPWFTRDYGFFSPTPMEWIEGGKLELKKGETFTLRYRVVVHAGDARAANIAGEFEKYVGDKSVAPDLVPPVSNVKVRVEGDRVIASQGGDESSQEVSVRIWGNPYEEDKWGFRQLDDDAEEEYCLWSRIHGSGHGQKLQIIDFAQGGIRTWSYDSFGPPSFDGKDVLLGDSVGSPFGAGAQWMYFRYRLTPQGLVAEDYWPQKNAENAKRR